MTTQDPNLTLEEVIDRFVVDTSLAHDFVKGDENLDVVGEEGTYPSLAKIAKNANAMIDKAHLAIQTIISDNAGMKVMRFDFDMASRVAFVHNAGTMNYLMKVINTDGNELCSIPVYSVDDDAVVIDFAEPEAGMAILQLFPQL